MNKKVFFVILISVFIVFASINSLNAQGECLAGGCSGGTRYPTAEFTTNSETWTIISTIIWAGEYAIYNVTAGQTYEWSLCSADGGSASYDSQLTLLSEDGTTIYCYSDDVCGLNAKISWTATFTGKVRVLVTQYNCQTNTNNTTLVWRCASCSIIPPPANDECSGAILLSVFNETCSSPTSGTVAGATGSGITSCYGTANNDVWYKFTATNTGFHTITVSGSQNFDAVIDVREGPSCNGTSIACMDNTFTGDIETLTLNNLTPGQTYFVRVYDYYSSIPLTTYFSICITSQLTCLPSYTMGTLYGDFIDGVELTGENSTSISNKPSGGGSPFIKDYISMSVDLKPGYQYSLTLTNGTYGGQSIAAWIDFNGDGIFDNDEKIGELTNLDGGVSGTIYFSVPESSELGNSKMLVRSAWSQTNLLPCETYSFGEAEIYGIQIISPCETPGTPASLTSYSINDNSASIAWSEGTPAGSPTVYYYWAIGTSSNVTYENNYLQRGYCTTLSVNINSLQPGTQYYWAVKAVTDCNWTSSNYDSASFTTTCITPGTPQNLITNNITISSAKLNWTAGNPSGSPVVTYFWALNNSPTVDYESNYFQRGTTTNSSVIVYNLNPGTQYYWTVKAVTNCGSGFSSSYASSISFSTISIDAPIIWTGTTNTDWNTATNWNPQQVPTILNNVIIPASCPRYPIITINSGDPEVALRIGGYDWAAKHKCKSLIIEPNASITIYRVSGSTTYYAHVYVYDLLDISGIFYHNPTSYSNTFRIFSGGDVFVRTGGELYVGIAPGTTTNEFPDIDLTGGTLNIEPGAKVVITDELRFQSGTLNMNGGELWIKYAGGGSDPTYGFNIYEPAQLNVSGGDIYICGQRNGSSYRMLDWNASANINITGGTIHIMNNQVSGTNNTGYLNFKGHKINNLRINRNTATNYLTSNDNNVIISGDLIIENGCSFNSNDLSFVCEGNIINNGTFSSGTNTITLKGSDKEIKGSSQTGFNNLTISEGASYSINHTHATNTWIPVAGNFTMENASTLTIKSDKQLSLSGNAIINGNIYAEDVYDNTVDVGLNGDFNISGNGTIYADFRVTAGTRTLTSDLICNGDFIINSGAGFTMTSHNFIVGGSWINNGTFTRGTGTVKFSGNNKQITGSAITNFYNLEILSASIYSLNPNTNDRARVYANFILNQNSVLKIASGKILDLYGPTILIDGDIISAGSHSSSIPSSGDGREIDINNDANLSGAGTINADLRIYANKTIISSDINLDGNLIIRDGATLEMSEHNLSISGNWSSPGNFICGNSTVIFKPTEDKTISTYTPISGGVVQHKNNFWNLRIQASPGKKITLERSGSGTEDQITNPYSGHLRVKNNLEILSGTFSTGIDGVPGRKIISNNVTLVEEGATLHISGISPESNWGYYVCSFYGDIILRGNITTSRPINSGFAEMFLFGARLKGTGNINEFGCDVQIHTTAITTQESDVYIQGDLIIQNDGTLICQTNKTLTIGGNFYIYENLTHKGTVNVYGNMTSASYSTNQIDIKSSVFNFIQSGSKFTYLDKKIEFGEVNIIGGTRVFRQDIDCSKDLTIHSGSTIDMYETSPKNLNLSNSADFINNGTFIPRTGKVSFTGDNEQKLRGSTTTNFYNLEINNTGNGVTIQKSANVSNQLMLTQGVFNTTTTNSINLLDQSTVSPEGGKENSYFNGPVYKTGRNGIGGNYSFVFPIGKNGIWARIAIEHHSGTTSTSDQFMAEYFDYPYPVVTYDESIEAVSIVEYWNLAKILGSSDLAKRIKLYSEDKNRSGIISFTEDQDLTVAHFNTQTQKWEDIGLFDSYEYNEKGWVLSEFNSNFSPFTFGSKKGQNPLPITLIHFGAFVNDNKVITHWNTASEYNTDYFIIQKSKDLIGFKDVGIIKASGFSNQTLNYSFIDDELWNGVSYYRLKSVDFDLSYQYSYIVAIEYNPENNISGNQITANIHYTELYPNPVSENLNILINLENDSKVNINVFDLSGKLIISTQKNLSRGENILNLYVGDLKTGFYIINISDKNCRISRKFIKN